jgi:hypothetical protein
MDLKLRCSLRAVILKWLKTKNIVVKEEGNQNIAYMIYSDNELLFIYTDPRFRQQGIASSLINNYLNKSVIHYYPICDSLVDLLLSKCNVEAYFNAFQLGLYLDKGDKNEITSSN